MSSDGEFERSSGNNTDDELDSPSRRNYDSASKRRKSKSKQIPIKKGHSRSNSSELHARPSAENFSKHMSHVHKIETFTQLHTSHSPPDGIIDPKLLDNKAEDVVEQSSSAPEPSIIPLQINAQNPKSNLKSVRRVLSDRKIRFSETKSDTDQEAARDLRSDSSSDKGSPPKFDRDMTFYQHDEDSSEDVQVLEYVDVHVKSLEENFGMHKAVQMYVNFLQEVYTDIDEESIPKIVERYQKWLFMKSKRPEKLLYMPLDVLFIFSVHITFLSSWDKLSQTLFGKLRKPSDLGRRDENLLRPTNRKWLRYYGETLYKSPYWESSSHDVRAEFPTEWKQLTIDIDLIAAAKERLMFLRRLESELDLNQLTSKVFYKQSKKQYQEFLFKLYHPNIAQNLRAPPDSEDEDDEEDVRLASKRKRGQNNDTNIEMKPITPRDKGNEASSSDGEVSLSLPIGSPRDTSSRHSSGKSAADPLALMTVCAGGVKDVRPNSAVTELFWQTHLQNPKRYRKDLRALSKLAELLEEEKAKERRMFERRKRERDNMQRKSQERKRGELSDRESDDLKSKSKKNSKESSKGTREPISQSQKKTNRVSSSGSGLESLKSSIKSPESRSSVSGHDRTHDRDNHRSGHHHSSRRNGTSNHHSRRQIQNEDSDDDIEAGRPSVEHDDFDETDDILVAAVSSKKVKSELHKRRSLIRTLGTVLFVITISFALAILVALAVGVSRGPIPQDWMALGIFGMVICVFTTIFGLFICLCPQRINIYV